MMRVGELVKWDDPGKNEVGVVMDTHPDWANTWRDTGRIQVLWSSDSGVRISYPNITAIKLAEPRKVNDSR